jgi:hypothetical protein
VDLIAWIGETGSLVLPGTQLICQEELAKGQSPLGVCTR